MEKPTLAFGSIGVDDHVIYDNLVYTVAILASFSFSSIDRKISRPSSFPSNGSALRSGFGIRPNTLPSAFMIPAILSSEPFGFAVGVNAHSWTGKTNHLPAYHVDVPAVQRIAEHAFDGVPAQQCEEWSGFDLLQLLILLLRCKAIEAPQA